ncbi:UNVERIFIED_CONTAM: hypothetical protein GTU68_032749 [Idotea baltica]|nr:hypothetical protein [Idotea baltica]
MEIFTDICDFRLYIKQTRQHNKSIGFVPTMGSLHQGHLELVKKSIQQNDVTICSIFVNPTQFNNLKDLENYPRDIETDLSLLKTDNCTATFLPSQTAIYKQGDVLSLNFGYLENIMEGEFRPEHFKGVGLIVTKLFNLVCPDRAYFGTKDLQQLTIIKKLTKELLYNIEIIPVQTVRETDGLAMSSRNRLLSKEERVLALDLYKALNTAKKQLLAGEPVTSVLKYIQHFFSAESKIELEYFEIVNTTDLMKVSEIPTSKQVSLCIAGQLGKVRLIDNMSLL